jgi:hypothetical protein
MFLIVLVVISLNGLCLYLNFRPKYEQSLYYTEIVTEEFEIGVCNE